jgi:hypothetical protein
MRAGFQQMDIDETNNTDNILNALGFEDGELEMFFEMNRDSDVSSEQLIQQLIQRYLEIAREVPFNLDWQSVQNAIDSPYQTSAIKPNGTPFTKHDIAKDVLDSFDDILEGGYKRRKSKTRTKKSQKSRTRKTKKQKRRRTRRH